MTAAVYRGNRQVVAETVPVPEIHPGEVLIAVQSCGICHTDLKKVEYDLLPPPRIYGHETAGIIAAVGSGVTAWQPGDRVIAFHHIPCRQCFYCQRKSYAQCAVYKRVGITAGFEPAGGGFAQYVRVMDWVVAQGLERIPGNISFDQACWVEPVNTCLKGIRLLDIHPGDVVGVLGQGPIGLIFTALANREQAHVIATDTLANRRRLSREFGARQSLHPKTDDILGAFHAATDGRGADIIIVATNAPGLVDQALQLSRPGAKILLFAQTSKTERLDISGADICVGERLLMGSYSADIDLQKESADLVFGGALPLEGLVSHRVSLHQIEHGISIAMHPNDTSMKVVVHPQ